MIYAEVIIDISAEALDRSFSYRVPEEMEEQIRTGMAVTVPFGRGSRPRKGYVTGISESTSFEESRIKEILSLDSSEETTESRLILLADWIRRTYGSTMIQALRTVFPVREKMRIREKRILVLQAEEEEARRLLPVLEKKNQKARARVLEAILLEEDHSLDYSYASRELGATASMIRYFVQEKILREEKEEAFRIPSFCGKEEEEKSLDPMQEKAVGRILKEWKEGGGRPVLIHGVTGSGKTEIYMEMIRRTLLEGKQVIVLIPEISLTYQNVRRFQSRFGDQVSILNSRLSAGERYDQFVRAKKGEVSIVVGPRSALFTPFTNLGLIIIDEEHEQAYKSESTPRYHARETALQRAAMEKANVLMGSATPSMEAYRKAEEGTFLLVQLPARHNARPLPEVDIVDMRQELKSGNRSILSRRLRKELEGCLERGEQAMLFLNRRGIAGFYSCRTCGTVMKCPHCDVSLSEHSGGRLICHYCGHQRPAPKDCPECGSPHIGGFKAGTEQVEQVVKTMFPKARILRMDSDTTRKKGGHEKILASFGEREADILIGTQMIVKGHDYPGVTLSAAVAADLSLNSADYRCAERTFQLLTQAIGRSGRGESAGKAVIQTYQPEHYSIQAASRQDYESFFRQEMTFRSMMGYPPAAHLLSVHAACREEDSLSKGMFYLGEFARRLTGNAEITVIGPAPEAIGRIRDMYRQVLYIKGEEEKKLILLREKMEQYLEINSGYRDIYIQFDLY